MAHGGLGDRLVPLSPNGHVSASRELGPNGDRFLSVCFQIMTWKKHLHMT